MTDKNMLLWIAIRGKKGFVIGWNGQTGGIHAKRPLESSLSRFQPPLTLAVSPFPPRVNSFPIVVVKDETSFLNAPFLSSLNHVPNPVLVCA
jgi:hypothetical protein